MSCTQVFSKRSSLVTLLVILAAVYTYLKPESVFAGSNGYISFDGTGNTVPGNCNFVDLDYRFGGMASTDDGSGNDYIAIVMVDANGIPSDVDFWSFPVGSPFAITDFTDLGIIHPISVRPVTIAIFDISAPGPIPENDDIGFAFATSGQFLAEAVFDPGAITTDGTCDNLPLKSAFHFATQTPLGSDLFVPGDDRINHAAWDRAAPVAVYCDATRILVWKIDFNTGRGYPAPTINMDYTEIDRKGVPSQANMLLAEEDGVQLWRLTTGEFQVNTHYPNEFKAWVFVWNACPPTNTYSLER